MIALDRVYDLVASTREEDEKPDAVLDGSKPDGYHQGWREARADLRRRLDQAMQVHPGDEIEITVPHEWQGIFVTHGRGIVSQLGDDGGSMVAEGLSSIERRIAVSRLRAWADELEQGRDQ